MSDIVERLRASVTQCRALDRAALLEEAAAKIERLRLTDVERASLTRAIETLEGVEYMEAFSTENDATAAATLRGLLERTK